MKLTLHIWRQAEQDGGGAFATYELDNVSEHMSFLEMLDFLNEDLISKGKSRWRSTATVAKASAARAV